MPTRQKLTMEQMGRLTADEYKMSVKTPLVLVADDIRSLNNVGSLFRTADAFRLERLILCGITAQPPSPEIHKTALGAEFSVDWSHAPSALDAVQRLNSEGYITLALEQAQGSISLESFEAEAGCRYALVVGNEVKGVSQDVVDVCGKCIEIPQFGTKHSLNVSVSAGIAIWEIIRKIRF